MEEEVPSRYLLALNQQEGNLTFQVLMEGQQGQQGEVEEEVELL